MISVKKKIAKKIFSSKNCDEKVQSYEDLTRFSISHPPPKIRGKKEKKKTTNTHTHTHIQHTHTLTFIQNNRNLHNNKK